MLRLIHKNTLAREMSTGRGSVCIVLVNWHTLDQTYHSLSLLLICRNNDDGFNESHGARVLLFQLVWSVMRMWYLKTEHRFTYINRVEYVYLHCKMYFTSMYKCTIMRFCELSQFYLQVCTERVPLLIGLEFEASMYAPSQTYIH